MDFFPASSSQYSVGVAALHLVMHCQQGLIAMSFSYADVRGIPYLTYLSQCLAVRSDTFSTEGPVLLMSCQSARELQLMLWHPDRQGLISVFQSCITIVSHTIPITSPSLTCCGTLALQSGLEGICQAAQSGNRTETNLGLVNHLPRKFTVVQPKTSFSAVGKVWKFAQK